jgi:hypothetical protein
MCVHPNGETTLLPGGNGDEGGGRSRPLNESPPAGRSRARGGSRGREQKKIGLLSFGTIFLCRGALLDPAKKGGREGVGAQRQNARARGMGGAPLGRVPCAEVKGRAGCRAGAGRGSPGFARRAKREAPAHTREGLWLAEGPGRALGQGLTNHQPACQGEGRVLPAGTGAYLTSESWGAGPGPPKGAVEKPLPLVGPLSIGCPSPQKMQCPRTSARTAVRRAAWNRAFRSPRRGDSTRRLS